ncbi:MAG TPA: ATP-dependent DNA helicase [Nocardioidaceae bacterium]|nr:ATP-dependent DNA helicase [Nocardioidaceae bacterium]
MSTSQGTDSVSYRLVRPARTAVEAPSLDASQRRVVKHPGGPLLVLAGPGTGKTTTLVEAVVDRVEHHGVRPEQVLVLTFSRKAAEELRDRITGRLARTVTTPLSSTFHSFCYALVRRFQSAEDFGRPLQLLSAPEQDVRIREQLVGSRQEGTIDWPRSLRPALDTRGLAEEVRTVMARARELSLDPIDLECIGGAADKPEWEAVGAFAEEYLRVLDAQNLIDYSELVHRAVLLAERPDVQAALRREFRAVFVDEYQDTDPAQVRLLQAIAGDGRDLVVVGDPDQSIYGFRGADVRGILQFPDRFRDQQGRPATVVPLATTRRFGSRLLVASRRVAAGLGLPGSLDRETFETFRSPAAAGCPYGDGRVEVFTYSSSGAELDHVADLLRRAHLEEGVGWSEMAVLVRSGSRSIPALRRALVAAGVPVSVSSDEVPLRFEPAVQPLLLALRVAADPGSLTDDQAQALLVSPLCGLDATHVRRLARELRREDQEAYGDERPPLPSAQLLRDAVLDPTPLLRLDSHAARRAAALAKLLSSAGGSLAAGEPPEQALWQVWEGTRWPRRLRAAVDHGGAAARIAHRDLDAVCALFEMAARAEERSQHRGAANFLAEVESQQIPADTLADKGARGEAVRLLTAHRSKGLQWRLVVIAGVQEGRWPDARRRGSLLQVDRLAADGLAPPPSASAMLAEERRLFYVAATRARERLVVTAVRSPDAEGEQPSRLIDDLGVRVEHVSGRPRRPMSLAGVVGSLRQIAGDPETAEPLRRAAASRLARLADARVDEAADGAGEVVRADDRLVPFADPRRWWGVLPPSEAAAPVRDEAPLVLSGSAVDGIGQCALRWFLSREAGGATATTTAIGFGNVVHVLAQQVADGVLEPDVAALLDHLDSVWGQLRFGAPWVSAREREEAGAALRRFVAWHRGSGRRLVGTEHRFEVTVQAGGEPVVIRGAMDRVEVDGDGAVVVVDLKTGKTVVTGDQVKEHAQLGVYQLAVAHGGVDDLVADVAERPATAGGAELVYLRRAGGRATPDLPKVMPQDSWQPGSAEQPSTPEQQVATAVRAIREERFHASTNAFCVMCEFRSLCPAQADGLFVLSPAEGAC